MAPAGKTHSKPNAAYASVCMRTGAPGSLALAITMAVIA